MAGQFSNALQTSLLNAAFRNTAYAAPVSAYLVLFSTAPTASTPGTELSVSGYSRQAVAFGVPGVSGSGEQIANTAAITLTAGAAWPAVVGVGYYDAATGGNYMAFDATVTSFTLASGDSVTFAIGALTITLT